MAAIAALFVMGAAPAFAGSFALNNYGDAGMNDGPPTGAILDLGGGETGTAAQTINQGAPVLVTVSFIATLPETDITLAFRDDPAFIFLSNVSVVNHTLSSGDLLFNGNFSVGTYTSNGNSATPIDWVYDNRYSSTFGGQVENNTWVDGSVQAYDAISQYVPTIIGDTYTLSFYYTEDNGAGDTTFSDLSTNGDVADTGGNGIDILAYASSGAPPAAVPEPASIAILGAGVLGLLMIRRRKAV